MPTIVMTKLKDQPTDKTVKAKIWTFLSKLAEDDTTTGLHIEKMNNPVDPRARTARVDQGWRAVLYRLDTKDQERTYVYAGTWEHDTAINRARALKVNLNSVNGAVELIAATMPDEAPAPQAAPAPVAVVKAASFLESAFNYSLAELTSELGFDEAAANQLLAAASDDEVLEVADTFENEWQKNAALALAVGDPVETIREDLGLGVTVALNEGEPDDDSIVAALKNPASKMQFTFVETDDELRRIIDGGDFGAWRVFLHPEQERYATGRWNGPFRLTGGAGTGKTVVLLHRARHLSKARPGASIALTTYTRALADNLRRDLERLDPSLSLSAGLGTSGILLRGVDQLAAAVRERAGHGFAAAAEAVFGAPIEAPKGNIAGNDAGWSDAITDVAPDLPASVAVPSFFASEYLQVILPARITTKEQYFGVRRPGRGVALDRKKRDEVWKVVERYRKDARLAGTISWAELSAIAAAWLEAHGEAAGVLVDHILVDEGQDLTPTHWQFLRALARQGADDMFLAEDTHQRIYGQHVVLSRYGIKITGRSRRLTLNYRTTEENLRYALGVLEGATYVDSNNETESVGGYRSSRRGPAPVVMKTTTGKEQLDKVAALVQSWIDEGVDRSTIAVLARSNENVTDARDGLIARGIPAIEIKSQQLSGEDKPVVLTMHTAKGMEFSRVVLFDVSAGVMPNKFVMAKAALDEHEDVLLRERSLLYVAASRARDVLAVSWKGSPSELLTKK